MNAAIITTVGTIIVALIGTWATYLKIKSDQRNDEQDRMDKLEERINAQEIRLDVEVRARRDAERRAHIVGLALETAIVYIERVLAWLDAGSDPPPPPSPDIAGLKAALRRARHPPDDD